MFAAVLRRGSRPTLTDAEQLLVSIKRTHAGDDSGAFESAEFAAAQTSIQTTVESKRERVPYVDTLSGRVMVSWLRIDNRQDLMATFGWDGARGRSATDADFVMAAYDTWGTGCADRLEGDFAFAIWDPHARAVYAARDATGIKPLYYCSREGLFACATSTTPLKLLDRDGFDLTVRADWIAQFLHHVSMDWTTTPFVGVHKVPPGHWVLAGPTDTRVVRYHSFVDDSPWESDRADHWLEEYRDVLHEAVRARIRTVDPIGVENSGGIDSSTVLALIATLAPETRTSMHTFGFVREALEPEYMLETSRVLGVRQNHVFGPAPWTMDEIDHVQQRGWATVGYPVEHSNSIFHIPFYDLARQLGVRTLHSGHGGDEIVTSTGHLALQERALRNDYRGLFRDVPGPTWRRPRTVAGVRRRRDRPREGLPLLQRLSTSPMSAIRLQDTGVIERTRSAASYDSTYNSVNAFALGDRLAPFVSVRTSECSIVAASYGIDYRWALLDRRLMQQWLSTPTAWKYASGINRYLHRRAIDGVVPDKVAWKPSKDMSGGLRSKPVITEPAPDLRTLHPAVADLIEPGRWAAAAQLDEVMARRTLNQAAQISAWLVAGD